SKTPSSPPPTTLSLPAALPISAPVNGPDPAEAAEPRQVPEDGAPDRRAPETGTESADGRQGGLWNWIKSKFSGGGTNDIPGTERSEEHTSELQSRFDLVCRLLL